MKVPATLTQVNINNAEEVLYWCHLFKCTEAQLRTAVAIVGTRPVDVRKHATGHGYTDKTTE